MTTHYEITLTRKRVGLDAPTQIRDSIGVAAIATELIGARVTESMLVLMLDGRNKVIGHAEVSRGGVSGCAVTAADVFRPAIVSGCAMIVLAHNHPSGEVDPSDDDREITWRLCSAGKLLGVPIVDHVIVSDTGRHFSFLDKGIMP